MTSNLPVPVPDEIPPQCIRMDDSGTQAQWGHAIPSMGPQYPKGTTIAAGEAFRGLPGREGYKEQCVGMLDTSGAGVGWGAHLRARVNKQFPGSFERAAQCGSLTVAITARRVESPA